MTTSLSFIEYGILLKIKVVHCLCLFWSFKLLSFFRFMVKQRERGHATPVPTNSKTWPYQHILRYNRIVKGKLFPNPFTLVFGWSGEYWPRSYVMVRLEAPLPANWYNIHEAGWTQRTADRTIKLCITKDKWNKLSSLVYVFKMNTFVSHAIHFFLRLSDSEFEHGELKSTAQAYSYFKAFKDILSGIH